MAEDLTCSFEIRLPHSIMMQIMEMSGRGKTFKSKSEALRVMITRGLQVEALAKIYTDPDKKTEFESKLELLVKGKNLAELAETMTVTEIESAQFVLANIKNKKIQQLILDVK